MSGFGGHARPPNRVGLREACQAPSWFHLLVGMLVALASGTFLAFGVYEEDLKNRLFFLGPTDNETDLTHGRAQTDTEALGTAIDLGDYAMMPLIGLLHDTIGPSLSSLVAAIFAGGGYLGVSLCVGTRLHGAPASRIVPLGVSLFAVGFGGGLGYTAALYHNSQLFTARKRSLVVGVLASGFGLSSTVFSETYRLGSHGREPTPDFLGSYFLLWAAALATIYLLSAALLRGTSYPVDDAAIPGRGELQPLVVNAAGGDAAQGASPRGPGRTNLAAENYRRTLSDPTFWLLGVPFWLAQGAGLTVTNNLASIVNAVSTEPAPARKNLTLNLAVLMSCSSVAGRLTAGLLGWILHRRLPRGLLVFAACLVMAVAQFSFALLPANSATSAVFTLVVATGWSVGVLWTVAATIVGECFGLVDFGKNYGLLALGPGMTGLAFNTLASEIFDRHSHPADPCDGEPSRTCTGTVCFQQTFLILGACCTVGTVVSVWLVPRTWAAREVRTGGGL
mmetsp:Transcript_29934/g.78496  ORF Transcript_29934/g.78496 Transcript_29934/m.78496 type:complete len:507 (-) Transcript_29934:56-1576(-)